MNFETIWRQSKDGLQMCSKVEQSAKVRRNELHYKIGEASNIHCRTYKNAQGSYSGPHPRQIDIRRACASHRASYKYYSMLICTYN